MHIHVSVPATSANIGPGFDIWGMALHLRNEFRFFFGESGETLLSLDTPATESVDSATLEKFRKDLSGSGDSLPAEAVRRTAARLGENPPPFRLELDMAIPLARGLGSSSTAILAGIVATNEYFRRQGKIVLSLDDIFQLACEMEGHPDNIAPALYGGFIVCLPLRSERHAVQSWKTWRLPLRAPLKLAGIIPHFTLETKLARREIPQKIDLATLAFQSSRTSVLLSLLQQPDLSAGDLDLFRLAIDEKIHQEGRSRHIPNMKETFDYWYGLGAIGCYLSGAGTTLLAFWPQHSSPEKMNLGAMLGAESTLISPEPDQKGLFTSYF